MALLGPIVSTLAPPVPMEETATTRETSAFAGPVGEACFATSLAPTAPSARNVSGTAPVKTAVNAIRKPELASVRLEYPESTAKMGARPGFTETIANSPAQTSAQAGGAIGCSGIASVPPGSTAKCAISDVLHLLLGRIASRVAIAIKRTQKDAIRNTESVSVRTDIRDESAWTSVRPARTDQIARKSASARRLLRAITSRESACGNVSRDSSVRIAKILVQKESTDPIVRKLASVRCEAAMQ